MISIIEVNSKKLLKKFVKLPIELYKGCEQYVPNFYEDEIKIMDIKKNPAAEGCIFKFFIAIRDGKVVGRIGGIINHEYNQKSGKKYIRFNRIDMVDDIEVTKALIAAVKDFGLQYGMEYIHGPWGFNDIDREGMLTFGFDKVSTYITMYSYPYYVEHLKQLGFEKEVGWDEFFIPNPGKPLARLQKLSDYILKRYELKILQGMSTQKLIKQYGMPFFDMVDKAYEDLYGTVSLNDNVKKQILSLFKTMISQEYMCFIVDKNDNIVGGGVVFPYLGEAVRDIKGKMFPFGFLKLLKAIKHPKKIEMAMVAVDKEYKNKGLNAVMINHIVNKCIANGIEGAETNPELESNFGVRSFWDYFGDVEHIKSRQTFTKSIN